MAQNLLDTVNFSTVPVTYTATHNLSTDDASWVDFGSTFFSALVSNPNGGVSSSAGGGNVRTGQTWTNDQWAQATMPAVPSLYALLGLRMTASSVNGYVAGANPGSFSRYRIYSVAAGVLTSLVFSTRDPTAGDILNFQIVGSDLTLLIYDSGMVLQETVPFTDTTYASGDGPALLVRHSDSTTKLLTTWTAGSVGVVAGGLPPVPAKRMVSVIYSQG